MPAHLIRTGFVLRRWFMAKNEAAAQSQFRHDLDPMPIILMSTENIVITGDERECHFRKCTGDLPQHLPFGIVMTVKQVAQKNHTSRVELHQQLKESLGIGAVCTDRYRNPRSAEMIDLPQMEVGQHQPRFVG